MTDQATVTTVDAPPRFALNMRWRLASEAIWFVLALLVAIVFFIVAKVMVSGSGARLFASLAQQGLAIALVLPATVLIMASGGLDLSVAGVAGLAMVIVGGVAQKGGSLMSGVALALMVGFGFGLLNALLVGGARINGVIVTLGTGALALGLSVASQSGGPQPLLEATDAFGKGFGLVLLWLIALLAFVVTALLLYLTPFGRRPQPGDEPQESWLARLFFVGSPYLFSSMLAALAGLVLLGRLAVVMPTATTSLQTDLLLAALVAGTPYARGYGNIISGIPAVAAAVLMNTVITLSQVQGGNTPFYLRGVLIVLAALLAHLVAYGAQAMYARRAASPEPAAAVAEES